MKSVGRNWDYAAVDWPAKEPKNIFASRHKSDGEIYRSADAGKSWKPTLDIFYASRMGKPTFRWTRAK